MLDAIWELLHRVSLVRVTACVLWASGALPAIAQTPLISLVAQGDSAMDGGQFLVAERFYNEALSMADPAHKTVQAGLFYKKALALRGAGKVLLALDAIEWALVHEGRDLFRSLKAELETEASHTVIDSGQIRDALVARSFGVSGRPASLDLWVEFEFDSAELTSKGLLQAKEMAGAMLFPEFEGRRFKLVGHTDVIGPAEYNLDLSNRRASRLRVWLVDRYGLRAGMLEAEGRGEEEPVSKGTTPTDHARNRRVEVKLLD